MLVKAKNQESKRGKLSNIGSYIFGGYNPYSWIEDNVYLRAPEAFIFSVTDGNGRKCIKFPIKPSKSDVAIR